LNKWTDPSHELFEAEYAILVQRVNGMLRSISLPSFTAASTTESSEFTFFVCFLWTFEHAGYVRSIINEVLADCHAVTLKKIDWLLEMEASATFTLNEHYFSDYRQKFLESYRNARADKNRGGDGDPSSGGIDRP
jgi:hypothetical protein